MSSIYADIAARTGGNIYIGVTGPVRTGKSTLIRRLMEQLVIPNIPDPARADRARDELPQSGSGRTIMTSEPKFVPEEAMEICPDGTSRLRVRLIDSVGYMVEGAVGATEDDQPRMVSTPWSDVPIPLTDAAELGTKKVMEDHASIGIVVTTDGTITDIPRADYIQAERRAIQDIQATGKPFLTIINTREPNGDAAAALQAELKEKYGVDAAIADCQAISDQGIAALLQDLLFAFPLGELRVYLPRWVDALDEEDEVRSALNQALLEAAGQIATLGQAESALDPLRELSSVRKLSVEGIDPDTGTVHCRITLPQELYYDTISKKAGVQIRSDAELIQVLSELTRAKAEYDRISDALNAVRSTGYGVVTPGSDEMTLEKPEILKKGSAYGVRLKASAPSIHMIRVDIDTEINPIVGGEQQSQDLIRTLSGEDPQQIWESNIFGKSVYELIREGLNAKLLRTPEDVQLKFRTSLSRIVNEGAAGLICIIL